MINKRSDYYSLLKEPTTITEHKWPEGQLPLVTTRTITYMHESYIRFCIESILMQKTTFPVEVVIHDDASTDRTGAIIREYEYKYPRLIKAIYQTENQFSKPDRSKIIKDIQNVERGRYIAFCEGDDFWADPYKLQKQVDFLEANPEYGMVHTGVRVVDKHNRFLHNSNWDKPSGDVFFDLFKSAFIVTCSVCVRREIVMKIMEYAASQKLRCVFDYWLWLHVAMRSKIKYFPDITSVYRSHPKGITKSNKIIFSTIIPLAVLDAVSYKTKHFPEKRFTMNWELYTNYCRALLARHLSLPDRKFYFFKLFRKPVFFLAFLPAIYRKLELRFAKNSI